jgi:hypothetical protein
MACCTITETQKIFLHVFNVFLILAGISGIVTGPAMVDSINTPFMVILIVAGIVCITVGSAGIYAIAKELVWLIYADAIGILLLFLGCLAASIAFFVMALTYKGVGDTAVAGRVMNYIGAGYLLGVSLLILPVSIIAFKLARDLSKPSTDKSLETSDVSSGRPMENPKEAIHTTTS